MPTNEELQQQLKLAQYKLKALLGITLAINKNMPAHDLLEKYRDILCEGLNVGTLVVFTIQDNLWNKVLSYGFAARYSSVAITSTTRTLTVPEKVPFNSLKNTPRGKVFRLPTR